MNTRRTLLLLLALYWCMPLHAEIEARYALIIGIKDYPAAPLKNSLNDARALSESLADIGFRVTTLADPGKVQLADGVHAFYKKVTDNDDDSALAVIYYAGHAVQISHHNYLVPRDIVFGDPEALHAGLYDVNDIFAAMPNSVRIKNVVILDACRNNPFEAAGGELSEQAGGLAPMRAPPDTLIAYSTEPGSVASDGRGKNSIYTKHLLEHIETPIAVEEVFRRVRRGVSRETKRQQIPWEHSSLLDEVHINPPRNKDMPDIVAF
jgi:uncharacterized caspase-like protein